jgi:hypothetical protein
MNRFHSSLLIAGALILFTLFSPLFRTSSIGDANQQLTFLYKQFAEMKNNKGISEDTRLIEGTKLQAQIETQKKAVQDAEAQADKKTTNEIIVTTCLALLLIWIVFWNVPILYLSFTAIALAVSVYSFLLTTFNLDLLSYDTMLRILVLCVGVVGTILFMGITLRYLFDKSTAIAIRDAELASNPIAITAHAKALELQVVSNAQQLAFNRIGQIRKADFDTFDLMKERKIERDTWSYDTNRNGWTEERAHTMKPDFNHANNHATGHNGNNQKGKGA